MKFSTDSKTDVVTHIAIIIAGLMLFFFAFFFIYLPWSTSHGEAIKVPNLKGLSYQQATDLLDDADLKYEISDSTFMPNVAANSVLSNFPKSGSNVKSGRKIYLTVAAYSAPMVKMPNITGRSISSAKNQLLSSGLIYAGEEKISALEENTVLQIKVNGQDVAVGGSIAKGSKVTLVVGDGYGNQAIDVPNIVGMPIEEAEILLSGQGLKIGSITYQNSDKADGTVTRQGPSAGDGTKIRIGAPINVWVAGNGTTPDNATTVGNQ